MRKLALTQPSNSNFQLRNHWILVFNISNSLLGKMPLFLFSNNTARLLFGGKKKPPVVKETTSNIRGVQAEYVTKSN